MLYTLRPGDTLNAVVARDLRSGCEMGRHARDGLEARSGSQSVRTLRHAGVVNGSPRKVGTGWALPRKTSLVC
jgi:hypothetical protein